ncbi:MAG: hypothetical protein PHI18_01800 [bacterium]|nr:hypothetical protein [bacterium]
MKILRTARIAAISLAILSACMTAEARAAAPGKSAFLKSLVIPGWGQYSLGQPNSALAFFGGELVLVGGMLTLDAYGRSTRDDYQALARIYGGVVGGHDHDFYVDVGNWMTVDQYNERRLRERDYDALYTSTTDRWSWDSNAHRAEMERIRVKSDRAFNSVIYLVGAMVANHIASAIHAGRTSARLRAQSQAALSPTWTMGVQPHLLTQGITVTWSYSF